MIVPASRERERDFTVHTCTTLLWERDVYIFVPTSCERESSKWLRPGTEREIEKVLSGLGQELGSLWRICRVFPGECILENI